MMKKTAILALSTVLASQLMGAEDINEMFKEGKVGGYARLHHVFEDLTNRGIAHTGSVVAGKLKYQTGALHGLRFGTALYTTHDTGLTKMKMTGEIAGGLLGDNFDGYSTLGEAYASYHISNTDITHGRQEFKTPMTESAVTFIPNLFEGTVATIKELPNTTITAAHITKMQYGTRSLTERNMLADEAYGITAGTGITLGSTEGGLIPSWGKESFQDMGLAMFGRTDTGGTQAVKSAGVTSLGIEYKKGDFKARIWDYYAHEMYNTLYADGEYKMDVGAAKVTLGAQVLKQDDVGNFENGAGGTALKRNVQIRSLGRAVNGVYTGAVPLYFTKISADGSIDALFWGAKAQADIGDFTFKAAFNKNEDGHVINTWGGDPGYTSTIFSRNEFRADTTSYKLGFEYDLKSFVPGLKFMYDHAIYDTDAKEYSGGVNATTGSLTRIRNEKTEVHDYVLHYVVPSVKGLWVRLFYVNRDNDTRKYEQDHTRLVANLSF